jgi:hypothetical protein
MQQQKCSKSNTYTSIAYYNCENFNGSIVQHDLVDVYNQQNEIRKHIFKVEICCIRLLIFVTNICLNSTTLSHLNVISKDLRGYTSDPIT